MLDKAEEMRERGLAQQDRQEYLRGVLDWIRQRRQLRQRQDELKNQIKAAPDHGTARELLRKLQAHN